MSTRRFARAPARPQFGRREEFFYAAIMARGRPPIPCLVRDLTPTGARVIVQAVLPPSFRLVIEVKGFESDCEIVARTQDSVEVRFV